MHYLEMDEKMARKNLSSAYDMPGYKAENYIDDYPGKPQARIVHLRRIQKKRNVLNASAAIRPSMIVQHD